MIQGPQLLIVLAIVLLLFGGSKLPKLARGLGEAQKEFREGLKDGQMPESANTKTDTPPADGSSTGSSTTTTSAADPAPPKPDAT